MKTKQPSAHAASEPNTLMRAKLELVAAREQGQADALRAILTRYPALTDELTAFGAALIATERDPWGDSRETVLADTQAVAALARSRALAAVFGATPVAAAAPAAARVASLKELWQARGLTMRAVAQRLGLGLDVLSDLEAGRIRVASAPTRLVQAFSELLDATLDQISGAMGVRMVAANLRSRQGASLADQTPTEIDFADAIRESQDMTAEQKATWLS